ncbi:hypothetical protein V2J09_005893 [Rumex salicifolius]
MGKKNRLRKPGEKGGKSSDAKVSEVGPSQVRGDEREVPECAKVADEEQKHKNKNCCLNVLLIGHAGAGKKKAQRKILELHLDNIKKHRTKDLSRHMAHSGINEEANSQYYLGFVPGFMRKASQADIAVLFISGCKDLTGKEKMQQTMHYEHIKSMMESALEKCGSIFTNKAFEAALKASENPFDTLSYREDSSPFSALIQGHQYRANRDIKKALSCYLSAQECFKDGDSGDKALSIMTQIITEVMEEKNREVSRQNRLKKKKEEKEEFREVSKQKPLMKKKKEETEEFSATASLNKEDEVEKSEVREVSKEKPLKKKKEETEEFSGASSHNKEDKAEKSEVGVREAGYPTNFITSVSETNETQGIDKFRICEVELSISPNYELRTVLDSVYSGFKIIKCINRRSPRSFIKCLASQTANYEKLEYLGLNGFNILNIEDAEVIKNETCFVVQPVKTLDAFFELELQNYWATSQQGMTDSENWTDDIRAVVLSEWWQFIEVKFKKIFNGVVNGLLFLDSMGYRCGDLSFSIYITDEGHTRLLPTMYSIVKPDEDIHDLVKCMRRIVFRVCSSSPSWMQNDLDHFFGFHNPEKLKYVPLRWLLNHYFFWSPRERIQFIHNLRHLKSRKTYKIFCGLLEEEMRKKDGNYFWFHELPDGIFLEIWRMGDPERCGLVQVFPYTNSDIITYMVAVYTHYNGTEYSEFRDETLDAVAIERKLVEIFPNIYGLIMDVLHALIEQRVRRGESIEDLNELLKDSSQHIDK